MTTSCCLYKRCGLLETIKTLPTVGWYYGNITLPEAERLLRDEPNGAFLVHDSTNQCSTTDLFTITFKIRNRFGSVRVDYSKGYFSLCLQDPGLPLFRTIMDLVSFCYNVSVVQKRPVCALTGHSSAPFNQDIHLYLTKPVVRHQQMHSLQFLCRGALNEYMTQDKIQKLPLPKHLIDLYLLRNPFYDEQLYPLEDGYECGRDSDRMSQHSEGSSRNSLTLETGNEL